jgi:hypothetical protein
MILLIIDRVQWRILGLLLTERIMFSKILPQLHNAQFVFILIYTLFHSFSHTQWKKIDKFVSLSLSLSHFLSLSIGQIQHCMKWLICGLEIWSLLSGGMDFGWMNLLQLTCTLDIDNISFPYWIEFSRGKHKSIDLFCLTIDLYVVETNM